MNLFNNSDRFTISVLERGLLRSPGAELQRLWGHASKKNLKELSNINSLTKFMSGIH